jgi:hypothetical protein
MELMAKIYRHLSVTLYIVAEIFVYLLVCRAYISMLKMESAIFSGKSVNFYQIKRHHILEDNDTASNLTLETGAYRYN